MKRPVLKNGRGERRSRALTVAQGRVIVIIASLIQRVGERFGRRPKRSVTHLCCPITCGENAGRFGGWWGTARSTGRSRPLALGGRVHGRCRVGHGLWSRGRGGDYATGHAKGLGFVGYLCGPGDEAGGANEPLSPMRGCPKVKTDETGQGCVTSQTRASPTTSVGAGPSGTASGLSTAQGRLDHGLFPGGGPWFPLQPRFAASLL